MAEQLIGVFEIAEMAGVTASAITNWRRRSTDFPKPLAELKSGPVFSESSVRRWLSARGAVPETRIPGFYDRLAASRDDSEDLRNKVEEVVDLLAKQSTTAQRPGMLLGKVQSGKTRAFLGVVARAFDCGYDMAIVLTKGTKSLAEQTLSRVRTDFREFIADDLVDVYDILSVPHLTPYEANRKLVFVVKKEDDNLRRLIALFQETYPHWQNKRVLLIDDEADMASVSSRKIGGVVTVGVISQQIDNLRAIVPNTAFLQVTATPYALYLQPDEEVTLNGNALFQPKRPAFTVLLPTHEKYAGGEHYFEKCGDPESTSYYLYREVPVAEREALKKEDRRRLHIQNVLTEKNSAVLRDAIVMFIVGGVVRRIQQSDAGERQQKYSFLFHTEQTRASHQWQERIAAAVRDALIQEAREATPLFDGMVRAAFVDLSRSIQLSGERIPEFADVLSGVIEAIQSGQLMITKVNSDNDIKQLLADDGQLKLRTPFNLFIGGQILDRGITIENLIAFYYGRSPNRFQQDTVLQHSRMYGARSAADLAVTRFYAPQNVYSVMKRIHEFDVALREAFESGAHDRGIYFVQKDAANQIVPCSPNKLLFSDVVSIRPMQRLVLSGFQTVSPTEGKRRLNDLDQLIDVRLNLKSEPQLVQLDDALELIRLAFDNLEFDDIASDERGAHLAALEHLSKTSVDETLRNKVWVMVAKDRSMRRYREEGRFSNAPDTKQQKDMAREKASSIPVLMLLRQRGEVEQQWRGLPFWWPVIVTPTNGVTSIFAMSNAIVR